MSSVEKGGRWNVENGHGGKEGNENEMASERFRWQLGFIHRWHGLPC